jgi:hypothetical protein
MSPRLKIISGLFKVAGIGMMASGFYLRNIDEYPSLLKLICPDYIHGSAAVRKINSGEMLKPEDEGFNVIAKFILLSLSELNKNPKLADEIKIDWVHATGFSQLDEHRSTSGLVVELYSETGFSVAGNRTTRTTVSAVNTFDAVENLKNKALFFYSRKIFFFGVVIEAIFYSIDVFAYVSALPKAVNTMPTEHAAANQNHSNGQDANGDHKERVCIVDSTGDWSGWEI